MTWCVLDKVVEIHVLEILVVQCYPTFMMVDGLLLELFHLALIAQVKGIQGELRLREILDKTLSVKLILIVLSYLK